MLGTNTMMTFTFGDTNIHVCESTARCIVYDIKPSVQEEVIDCIDSNNFVCVGAHSIYQPCIEKFAFMFKCPATNDFEAIQRIEEDFE